LAGGHETRHSSGDVGGKGGGTRDKKEKDFTAKLRSQVDQIDALTGELVRRHESLTKAAEHTRIGYGLLYNAIRFEKIRLGCRWQYADLDSTPHSAGDSPPAPPAPPSPPPLPQPAPSRVSLKRAINQIDAKTGELVRRHESMRKAAHFAQQRLPQYTRRSLSFMWSAIRHNKILLGCRWQYADLATTPHSAGDSPTAQAPLPPPPQTVLSPLAPAAAAPADGGEASVQVGDSCGGREQGDAQAVGEANKTPQVCTGNEARSGDEAGGAFEGQALGSRAPEASWCPRRQTTATGNLRRGLARGREWLGEDGDYMFGVTCSPVARLLEELRERADARTKAGVAAAAGEAGRKRCGERHEESVASQKSSRCGGNTPHRTDKADKSQNLQGLALAPPALGPVRQACMLCQQLQLDPKLAAGGHGERGRRAPFRLLALEDKDYCHDLCALFAEKMPLERSVLTISEATPLLAEDVDRRAASKVRRDVAQTSCKVCKGKGAASRCSFDGCDATYHLPCAEAAGLVEWHYFNSSGLRVVHCPSHRDPLLEIYWDEQDNPAWWPAAVTSGPNEGFVSVIYTAEPYESEDLNMNAKTTKLRFPHKVPRGCRRWEAFQALFAPRTADGKARHEVEKYLGILQPTHAGLALRDDGHPLSQGNTDAARAGAAHEPCALLATYTAQENDTPRALAKNFGIDVHEFMALNQAQFSVPLLPKSRFKGGTHLLLPPAKQAATQASCPHETPSATSSSGRAGGAAPESAAVEYVVVAENSTPRLLCSCRLRKVLRCVDNLNIERNGNRRALACGATVRAPDGR